MKRRKLLSEKECVIIFINEEKKIVRARGSVSSLYGYSSREFVGKRIDELVVKRKDANHEIHRRKDGSTFEVRIFPTRLGKMRVLFICEKDENNVLSLINNAKIGALVVNRKEEIAHLNESAKEITGWSGEITGKKVCLLFPEKCQTSVFNSDFNEIQTLYCKDGTNYKALTFSIIFEDYAILFFDPIERNEIFKRLNFMAYHDELTSLPTHALLIDRISQAFKLSKRNGEKVAILFLDLDDFKRVNDAFSHRIGNLLLQVVAQRLKSLVRGSDTVARIGGDEFVVVLRVRYPQGVLQVIQKIMKSISEPIVIGNREISISASIGVTFYPDDGTDIEELIHQADMAMYKAKASGKGSYAFYGEAIDEKLKKRINLEKEIIRALKEDEFELYYQPIIDLKISKLIATESLIRWHHPKRGLLVPDEFIPFSQEGNSIKQIGKWVIERACNEIRILREKDIRIPLTVNVSALEFQSVDFSSFVNENIQKFGINSKDLILELTETVLLKENAETQSTINEIKLLGLRLALDDFGTGYSNLKYLTTLPIDILKIDISFIKNMLHNPRDLKVVQAIISLGKSLNMLTVAEGVENKEQLDLLKNEGCDAVQGYLFSKPLRNEEFVAFCEKIGSYR